MRADTAKLVRQCRRKAYPALDPHCRSEGSHPPASSTAAQPNERLRQTRFDRLLVDTQMLGDLIQGHSGEAMENENVARFAWQSADRPDENPALAFFG
nr:hypothetical protein [Brevundimonas diminuta]